MSTSTKRITDKNFKELVDKDGIVLLDWWAPWCGPCRVFGPVFEKAAAKHTDIMFGKVNTEEEQALAAAFSIRSIPTLMVFRDQVLVFSQPGALPGATLEELIGKVRALDMREVHCKVAQDGKAGDPPAAREQASGA
jgi:thioredoxin 1